MTQLQQEKNVSIEHVTMLNDIHEAIRGEGWSIFESHGTANGSEFRIEKVDDDQVFETDADAVRFVVQKASEGSQTHINALVFMTMYGTKYEMGFIIKAIIGKK
jgi:hypothetical protein